VYLVSCVAHVALFAAHHLDGALVFEAGIELARVVFLPEILARDAFCKVLLISL
jgi:hypothetical protein